MKILIRATNWVGDAIMALPALRAVRRRFHDAQITIVARPYVADIYRHQQLCDQLFAYDPQGLHAGFSGRERLVAQAFPSALATRATAAAFYLRGPFPFPGPVKFLRMKNSII